LGHEGRDAPSDDIIRERARGVLLGNRMVGHDRWSNKDYAFTCPSAKKYPFQWFWDSCFHAIALSHLEVGLAKEEILTLLSAQSEDGFLPHVVFWRRPHPGDYIQSKRALLPPSTALTQPPVLAQAVEVVFDRSGDEDFLRRALPGVKQYYLWLLRNRDPDRDGLISIISPYEGLDYSPAYDAVLGLRNPGFFSLWWKMRRIDFRNWLLDYDYQIILKRGYFEVEDVLVNSILSQGLSSLSRLCRVCGEEEESISFLGLARDTERAIVEKCYDEGEACFYSLYSKAEVPARVKTIASLFPLILDEIDEHIVESLVEKHLLNENEFWLPFPVPSVACSESSFDPAAGRLLWRGPTWVNGNWFIVKGLEKHGYREVAESITQKTRELVLRSGFREFYNPLTGEGLGERDFSWSTLVLDLLGEGQHPDPG